LPSVAQVLQDNHVDNPKHTPRLQAAAFMILQNYIEFTANTNEPARLPGDAQRKWKAYVSEKDRLVREHKLDPELVRREAGNPVTFQRVFRRLTKQQQDAYNMALEAWRSEAQAAAAAESRDLKADLVARLPSAAQVISDNRFPTPRTQTIRQVAALWVLLDYLDAIRTVKDWGEQMMSRDELTELPKWQEYYQAQEVLRKESRVYVDFLDTYFSRDFRSHVLGSLPDEYRRAYTRARRDHQELVDPRQLDPGTRKRPVVFKDDGRYSKQKERARRAGVDLTVFGIELYAPLDLRDCPRSVGEGMLELLSQGVLAGAEETCVTGGAGATTVAVRGALEQAGGVQVALDSAKCPLWARGARNCDVLVETLDGYALGVRFAPVGKAQREIVPRLNEKYGKRPTQLDYTVRCDNPLMDYAALRWTLPGLTITYQPMNASCLVGDMSIQTDEARRLGEAVKKQRKAAEPKM
jgi:hypothetical protein